MFFWLGGGYQAQDAGGGDWLAGGALCATNGPGSLFYFGRGFGRSLGSNS